MPFNCSQLFLLLVIIADFIIGILFIGAIIDMMKDVAEKYRFWRIKQIQCSRDSKIRSKENLKKVKDAVTNGLM